MEVDELFNELLDNLKVVNRPAISARRDEIAKALNKEFRALPSSDSNQLMVGSYGRGTAIAGISDLDMIFILPASMRDQARGESGPLAVLTRTRKAILARYTTTDVRVDQCVVAVHFQNFKFEVQPVFENADGSFSYPDTYARAWKETKPRAEIEAMRSRDAMTRGNLRNLCKLARAWKNANGVVMGGLLIDTLAYNFLLRTDEYDSSSTASYDYMVRDFFKFMADEENHEHYAALGSRQRVRVKKRFQRRARRAYESCLEAIAAEGKASMSGKWKAVFGRPVPSNKVIVASASAPFHNTEEFVEDTYAVDVQYSLTVDCKVTQDGFRPAWLTKMLRDRTPLRPKKGLDFSISDCEAPEPYTVKWKVLNRGPEAERRDNIRGQIIDPNRGGQGRHETTNFRGDHYIECYIIKDGIVVARDRLIVPITLDSPDV